MSGEGMNIWQYYDELLETANRWLENVSVINMDCFFRNLSQRPGQYGKKDEIKNRTFDVFRKYIFSLVRSGIAVPKSSCVLLQNYVKNTHIGPNHADEVFLRMFLSCFTRTQFDYFIKRYYFLDETVLYNHKIERKIARYLKQRGVKEKLTWNSSDDTISLEEMYVKCLDSIPEWFITQIGEKGILNWHSDAAEIGISMKYCRRSKNRLWVNLIGGVIIAIASYIYIKFFS